MSVTHRRQQNFEIEKAVYDLPRMARIADDQMRRILERSGALDEQYIIAIGRLTRHLREIAEDCNAIFEATWTAFDCR